MKPKKASSTVYTPGEPETPQQIREAAAAYGIRRDVVAVREAKDQLSALLQRAARGEQIVITSDGEPKAMIVRYRPVLRGKPWQSLKAFRDTMPMQPDSQALIDEDRADRW
ncbi:MAG: type II toxin-antitoxin system prevent-host-death family antitoxin [Opitutae bacterium]|nr:type II toxin-antitoxin system prevent-host-death family antitoxin [Opitutae bacterium]